MASGGGGGRMKGLGRGRVDGTEGWQRKWQLLVAPSKQLESGPLMTALM